MTPEEARALQVGARVSVRLVTGEPATAKVWKVEDRGAGPTVWATVTEGPRWALGAPFFKRAADVELAP